MKIIVAPDKFKGSLTSAGVCDAITQGIQQVDENIDVQAFPMADGGDGFAAVMQYYTKTETVHCKTVDPLQRPVNAAYQWDARNKTAIIELAAASGLVLLQMHERNPLKTSAYGTGLMIKAAIDKGATKIILGIGGSATNDAGTGILAALGFVFAGANGETIPASGAHLILMQQIILPPVLPAVRFELACDVDNVLYGPQGAAYVYAPQKGASKEQVKLLDDGLQHFAAITMRQTNCAVAAIKGAGAAGGIAAGILPFFDTVLRPGTQMVIEASNIEHALPGTDLIFTGEGRIDNQSKDGKLVSHITAIANRKNIPVIGLCGSLALNGAAIKELGLDSAFGILKDSAGLDYSIKNAAVLLRTETARVLRAFIDGNRINKQ